MTLISTAGLKPAATYLMGLGEGSRRSMRSSLDIAARELSNGREDAVSLPWSRLEYIHVAALRARLNKLYAPATVNKILAAVRGVAKEAWRLGEMADDVLTRIKDVSNVSASSLPTGRMLSRAEISKLFSVCSLDTDFLRGARDSAILAILVGCGLRRSEVSALTVEDVDMENGVLRVENSKRNKDRMVPVPEFVKDKLEDWFRLRGREGGPLFFKVSGKDRMSDKGLSDQSVYNICQKRSEQADLESFSPHDIRRTYISMLLERGADISTVSRMAGHSDVKTTALYDRRGMEVQQKAASLLEDLFA